MRPDAQPRVIAYRVAVLVLAAAYSVERALAETWVMADFGWQFRYLTNWALTLSLISAGLMLTARYGRRDGPDGTGDGTPGAVFASVTAVINMMVVASYWRLYFQDPTLVNGENAPVPYREYYLHLVGPALQWADVLLLKRGFRHLRATALWLGLLVLAYVAWAELVVAPLNDGPVGSVATGLPYPFLNDMAFPARLGFYAATGAAGLVFLLVLRGVQAAVDRLSRQKSRSL